MRKTCNLRVLLRDLSWVLLGVLSWVLLCFIGVLFVLLCVLLSVLWELGLNIPRELYAYADALTPHYTMAWYPGRKPLEYNKGFETVSCL